DSVAPGYPITVPESEPESDPLPPDEFPLFPLFPFPLPLLLPLLPDELELLDDELLDELPLFPLFPFPLPLLPLFPLLPLLLPLFPLFPLLPCARTTACEANARTNVHTTTLNIVLIFISV